MSDRSLTLVTVPNDPNEERLAAIAFILDRVARSEPTSDNGAFAAELVAGLAEGRHIDCARAGAYDELSLRVQLIMMKHSTVTPLVRRPKLRTAR